MRTKVMRTAAAVLPSFLLRPLSGPLVVFFHGVEQRISNPGAQAKHNALDDFEAIAMTLKRSFEVAPLSELANALRRPQRHRRTVFLTSDDGYANTLTVAAPLLKALGLPWTLFISTRHIDTGELNPMFVARAFLREAPDATYGLPHLAKPLDLNGPRTAVSGKTIEALRFLPADAARPPNQAVVQTDGQELGRAPYALAIEHVEGIAHVGEEVFAR